MFYVTRERAEACSSPQRHHVAPMESGLKRTQLLGGLWRNRGVHIGYQAPVKLLSVAEFRIGYVPRCNLILLAVHAFHFLRGAQSHNRRTIDHPIVRALQWTKRPSWACRSHVWLHDRRERKCSRRLWYEQDRWSAHGLGEWSSSSTALFVFMVRA